MSLGIICCEVVGKGARIPIDKVPEFQGPEGAVYLKGKSIKVPVLVVKTKDNTYLGFVNRCTHMGHRKLDPVSDKSIPRCCSVSHSTYDLQGRRLSGPAKEDLETYDVTVVDNELVIKL